MNVNQSNLGNCDGHNFNFLILIDILTDNESRMLPAALSGNNDFALGRIFQSP